MRSYWEVFEYDGPDWAARLERDWLRIYAAMPLRSVFHSHHAHLLYARHLMAPGHRLRYFGLHDGTQVRALCPLEATLDYGLGIPMRVWATPYDFHHWPLSDVICPEDEARAALIPLLADFLARSGERRPLLFGPVPTRAQLWNGLEDLPGQRFCAYQADVFDVFDCTLPFDELLGRCSGKFRQNLRRQEKRLQALPGVRYTCAAAEPDLSREFERFLTLEASGWKATAGNVVKFQPEVAAFYRGLLSLSDAGDHAMMLGISTEGRSIASQFMVRTGGQLTFGKTSYDEEYARLAPGLELLRHRLEQCCADPEIGLLNLIGSPAWLQRWQPEKVAMGRACVHTRGMGSRAHIAAMSFRYGPARPILQRVREERDRMRPTRQGDGA